MIASILYPNEIYINIDFDKVKESLKLNNIKFKDFCFIKK